MFYPPFASGRIFAQSLYILSCTKDKFYILGIASTEWLIILGTLLRGLFNSMTILRQDILIVPVSGIPSPTETGGSGSAATKAKVDSEGAPTARILGSALYPPSAGVPDNLPLVSQTHWPTTGYHKNQYSSYYPHDPAYWYRLAGKLL